ncbi:MAG: hypothetical protein KAR79_01440 [Simkaniaceae bacterium]|nr:hypothetical protein [Simkaniaceae bacterium]
MSFQITSSIWNNIYYNENSFYQMAINDAENIGSRSCAVIIGIVSALATPIFLAIDLLSNICCLSSANEVRESEVVAEYTNFLEFYRGNSSNAHGVTLSQIWNYSEATLESQHNYIQWLFPSSRQSRFNLQAPLVNEEIQRAFREAPNLQANLDRSFIMMLRFYGLEKNLSTGRIVKGSNFQERSCVWMTPSNHNFLRLDRMIKSLSLLGKQEDARSLYFALESLFLDDNHSVLENSLRNFWSISARIACPGLETRI